MTAVLLFLLCLAAPHVPFLWAALWPRTGGPAAGAALLIAAALCWTVLHVRPIGKHAGNNHRVRILAGGRRLVRCGLLVWLLCIPFYLIWPHPMSGRVWALDLIWAALAGALLCLNGMARILLTARRLNVVRRWVVFVTAWVPILGAIPMLHACHIAKVECEHELYKAHLNEVRAENEICKTRYPLVMVHGVGFRDVKYVNYWGRIPRELIRNGATVFYGNQEAFGTIAHNAADVKKRVLEILEETDCEKVNIIAHSKGGLDSRCAISQLGLAPYVASLTTVSTPHRGCRFVDKLVRMPDWLFRALSRFFDRFFRTLGDKNPDFYTTGKQFTTSYAKKFNSETPNMPEVYYQSYMSVMGGPFSHLLLTIPYLAIRPLEGENDGLVSLESSKWGAFRGVFRPKGGRGISHGDIIDLTHQDYKGYDPMECFVEIVSDLKNRGF